MTLHLLAHNNKNFVKEGDIVEQYKTKIGTIGTGNGSYYAHLHHSLSEGLSVVELRRYINGWTIQEVGKYYSNPAQTTDYTKMFGRVMDVGNRGFGWLQAIGNGSPHPGQDINGTGGGNTDLGYEYTSPCNGEVIYVNNTTQKDGWGKMVVIKEITIKDENMVTKDLKHAIEDITGDDYGKVMNEKEQDGAAKDLKEFKENLERKISDLTESAKALSDSHAELLKINNELSTEKGLALQQIDRLKDDNQDLIDAEKVMLETINEFEKELGGKTLNSFALGRWLIIIKEKA